MTHREKEYERRGGRLFRQQIAAAVVLDRRETQAYFRQWEGRWEKGEPSCTRRKRRLTYKVEILSRC